MNCEMIIRITDTSQDVEVLINSLVKNEVLEKNITFRKLLEILEDHIQVNESVTIKCEKLSKEVIGFGFSGKRNTRRYIINQPEHKRYVTVSIGEMQKAYMINFPASIYIVDTSIEEKIQSIECYMYIKFKDDKTELYKYAMPNMLSENRMCIGSALSKIRNNNVIQALENIIYSPYSHSSLNNVKGFKSTTSYFEYLCENTIQKKHLYPLSKKLKDLF